MRTLRPETKGPSCEYGFRRRVVASQLPGGNQGGGDHRVEYTRAGQQFDADDRSGDDTGHRPSDQRLTRSRKLSRQSACQSCSAVLCRQLRRSVAC